MEPPKRHKKERTETNAEMFRIEGLNCKNGNQNDARPLVIRLSVNITIITLDVHCRIRSVSREEDVPNDASFM